MPGSLTIFLTHTVNISCVSISSRTINSTARPRETVYLQCSVDITPHPLPANTSTPEFEWFFGQTLNQTLNSRYYNTTNIGSTYSSTLAIPSVNESDSGMYTCRLRGNHMTAVSTMLTVEQGA